MSEQIAMAIERKQYQEAILAHKQNLENEVALRSSELAQTLEKLSESEKHFRETIELLPEAGEFRLDRNDVLFLYTDGVIEICNHNREQYDIHRLETYLIENGYKHPEQIKSGLLSKLNAYMGKQMDDITFLIRIHLQGMGRQAHRCG